MIARVGSDVDRKEVAELEELLRSEPRLWQGRGGRVEVRLIVDAVQREELQELFKSGVTDLYSEHEHLEGAAFVEAVRPKIEQTLKRLRAHRGQPKHVREQAIETHERYARFLDLYDQFRRTETPASDTAREPHGSRDSELKLDSRRGLRAPAGLPVEVKPNSVRRSSRHRSNEAGCESCGTAPR